MKKVKKIILIFLTIIILHNVYKMFIKEYNITYKVDKYTIKEHFYQVKKHYYDLIITNNKENYTYTIEKKLNKKKKIIKKIKKYSKNNINCIIPIYIKETKLNIYCTKDNNQVSIDYLLKTNNKDFNWIKEKTKKYSISYPKVNNTKVKYKKLNVYSKNIKEDDIYFIWNYKGLYVLENNKNQYYNFLSHDLYDNIVATTVNNYYVLLENTSVNGIDKVYYYDIKKRKVKNFKLKKRISKDSYINGVEKDLIYITDKKEKKEYTLNIKKKRIQEIDENQTEYIIYINGKKQILSKSDFFMKNHYFDNNIITDDKITINNELKKKKHYYYFFENNKLYKVLETNKKQKTLLLELSNVKEWQIIEDEIILLKENTIYSYTEEKGLQKIIENNELKYNYKNIYKIGKK